MTGHAHDGSSNSVRKSIEETVKQVHHFFVRILLGFPRKPIHTQNAWRVALVNFLQKYHFDQPIAFL